MLKTRIAIFSLLVICAITLSANVDSLAYAQTETPPPVDDTTVADNVPTNLSAEQGSRNSAVLSWDAPVTTTNLLGYKISCLDEKLSKCTYSL